MSDAWNICRCCGSTFLFCAINKLYETEESLKELHRRGYPPRFCSWDCKELSENEKHWEEPRAPAMREYEWL